MLYPVTDQRIEVWFDYYKRFDPEVGNMGLEDWQLNLLPINLKRIIVQKCMREDALIECLHEDKHEVYMKDNFFDDKTIG